MQKLSIAIALVAFTSAHPAFAAGVAEPGRSQTVSVFDGESLLAQTSLPNDVTTIVKSDSAKGNDVNGTTVFSGNVVMEVRRDDRQLMLISGDRMVVQNAQR